MFYPYETGPLSSGAMLLPAICKLYSNSSCSDDLVTAICKWRLVWKKAYVRMTINTVCFTLAARSYVHALVCGSNISLPQAWQWDWQTAHCKQTRSSLLDLCLRLCFRLPTIQRSKSWVAPSISFIAKHMPHTIADMPHLMSCLLSVYYTDDMCNTLLARC